MGMLSVKKHETKTQCHSSYMITFSLLGADGVLKMGVAPTYTPLT